MSDTKQVMDAYLQPAIEQMQQKYAMYHDKIATLFTGEQTTTVGIQQSEPVTAESMIEIVERLNKDLPACWHYDLVTSPWLPKPPSGIAYMCVKCCKLFSVSEHLLEPGEPPKRISIDPFVKGSILYRDANTKAGEQ